MARNRRDSRVSVAEALDSDGYAFDFFQAVRLLESMRPDAAPVGTGADPSAEAIRFRSHLALSFPASEIVDASVPATDEEKAEMVVSFLGVAGAQGPLPRPFTELILDRVADRDPGARDFLDIFNHRLISLLYRAREKHRVGLRIQPPERSLLAGLGFSLMGLGGERLRRRLAVDDRSLLLYAGTLSHGRRTAVGLEGILSDYLRGLLAAAPDAPPGVVTVREFVGQWHRLGEDQATVLGVPGGRCRLGVDAVLGGQVWDQTGMIEVVVGPLDFESFLRVLPGGDAVEPVRDIISFYLRDEAAYRIRPVLRAAEVPGVELGRGSRLGLTSWLKTRPFTADADDVVLY